MTNRQKLWDCMREARALAIELDRADLAVATRGLQRAYRDLYGPHVPPAAETETQFRTVAVEVELRALCANLTVLAAAWASNANHDPHPSTACAWRTASEALDELLETPR